jgi:ribonuclease Z
MKPSLLLLFLVFTLSTRGQEKKLNSGTQLVLIGTGTPNPVPERSGPSLAIVVNQQAYIVDCGPGVVRRAAEAARKNLPCLNSAGLTRLFITHLHSDHTLGYPDILLSPAVTGRDSAIEVYGPKGLQDMTQHILAAYKEDIDIRLHGLEMGHASGYQVHAHEINPGIIYRDANLTVKAFRVNHGSWPEAFGFRFETNDKVIVVSGDCTYSESLIENAKDCDILVHEVYSMEGLAKREKQWQHYHSTFHTSTAQLAAIANKVHPKLLVLTHALPFGMGEASLLKEITDRYKGDVQYGKDLDIY